MVSVCGRLAEFCAAINACPSSSDQVEGSVVCNDIMRDLFRRVVQKEELPKGVSFFNPIVFNPNGQVIGRANGLPDIMRMHVRNGEFVFCPCKLDPLGVVVLLGTENPVACGIIGRGSK